MKKIILVLLVIYFSFVSVVNVSFAQSNNEEDQCILRKCREIPRCARFLDNCLSANSNHFCANIAKVEFNLRCDEVPPPPPIPCSGRERLQCTGHCRWEGECFGGINNSCVGLSRHKCEEARVAGKDCNWRDECISILLGQSAQSTQNSPSTGRTRFGVRKGSTPSLRSRLFSNPFIKFKRIPNYAPSLVPLRASNDGQPISWSLSSSLYQLFSGLFGK